MTEKDLTNELLKSFKILLINNNKLSLITDIIRFSDCEHEDIKDIKKILNIL